MWIYQKKLEYPVNITTPNPRMAKALMAPVSYTHLTLPTICSV